MVHTDVTKSKLIVMVIKKGTHAPFRLPSIIFGNQELHYKVRFTTSCRYTLPTEDQADINKLIGIGYLNSIPLKGLKPVPFHHCNSVRFGWHYDPAMDNIVLWAYWYAHKERKYKEICRVGIGEEVGVHLTRKDKHHTLTVTSSSSVIGVAHVPVPTSAVSYLLRPFFGGNNPAPHDIEIDITDI
jgi:hypothetical protein